MIVPFRADQPQRRLPIITAALVAANCGVYLYFLAQGGDAYDAAIWRLGCIPRELWAGNLDHSPGHNPLVTVLTAMFMHAGIIHLLGNMLVLWVFGPGVEGEFGHLRYLAYYAGCGVAAALLHIVFHLGSDLPMVGASGAVAGVMGGYLARFARARVHAIFFIFIFPVTFRAPAWAMLGYWFILQVLGGLPSLGAAPGAGVAYLAHVGGFGAGFWYMRNWRRAGKGRRYHV